MANNEGERAVIFGALPFVVRSGTRWEMLPHEMECGSGAVEWRVGTVCVISSKRVCCSVCIVLSFSASPIGAIQVQASRLGGTAGRSIAPFYGAVASYASGYDTSGGATSVGRS